MIKNKKFSYCSFMVTVLIVVLVFVTATTYIQLIVGALLYIPLAYFAFKVFPRKRRRVKRTQQPSKLEEEVETKKESNEGWGISDLDKRAFLKLIGGAGLALFLFSLFNKRAENQFFEKAIGVSGAVYVQDVSGNKINPAQRQPTDGYSISEIDDNVISYYGFTNKDGEWFVMKVDTTTGSFRYIRGGSDFPESWIKREELTYDYFNNIF